jgi:exodeoxyribonuclease X
LLKNAHSAAADIALCFHVFCCALLTIQTETPLTSWGAIWRLSEAARMPKKMDFGKHRGLPIAEVPRDYVDWYRGQDDTDPYLIKAFQNAGLCA